MKAIGKGLAGIDYQSFLAFWKIITGPILFPFYSFVVHAGLTR